jgi:hypothetical protein
MVAFKKMWDDVCTILANNEIKDIQIVENYNSGFVVKENENTYFVNKDDFVDFWCNMLFFNKVDEESFAQEGKSSFKYVYKIIKKLPYITESEGALNLTE